MPKQYQFVLAVVSAATILYSPDLLAEAHFQECVSRTGVNAHLLVPANLTAAVGDDVAEEGDELAVFTSDGTCAGMVAWGESARALTIWGDDDVVPGKLGFSEGEALHFVFWDASSKEEYWSVSAELETSDDVYRPEPTFAADAVYLLRALTVFTQGGLVLNTPADDARFIPLDATLRWSALPGASSYDLQVSTSATFGTTVVDESGLTENSFALSGLAQGTRYHWRVRAHIPDGLTPYSAATFRTLSEQTISLVGGWNMVSSRVMPGEPRMDGVFGAASDDILLVKDAAGRMFYPEFNINTIGEWDAERGYLVYARTGRSVRLWGDPISLEDTLSLGAGWNMIAYWPDRPIPVPSAMGSIAKSVVLVKNGAGQVWLPEFEINTIGNLTPGSGYQVHVRSASNLSYPSASASAGKYESDGDDPSGAERSASDVLEAAIGNNATLLVMAPELSDGMIVQAVSGDAVVGEASIERGRAVIILRGDDDFTPDVVEGARNGERLVLRVKGHPTSEWLGTGSFRSLLSGASTTTLAYSQDGAWVADAWPAEGRGGMPERFELDQNYPNPFNPSTTIAYALPEDAHVRLEVYNALGQRVRLLVDEEQTAGRYEVVLRADNLPSGVYLYRVLAGRHSAVRQMTLLK